MKNLSRGLLYHGIRESLNGKILYMKEAIRVPHIKEEVCRFIAENDDLREKIGYISTKISTGTILEMKLYEEDLEVLFDEMCSRKMLRTFEKADEVLKFYMTPILSGEKEIECDISGYILSALVMNMECREMLHKRIVERGEFYSLWEKNKSVYDEYETCIPVQYIWDFRALAGMLERIREEVYRGSTYRCFMEIVYAGYGYLKREWKNMEKVNVDAIRIILIKNLEQKNNMFLFMSQLLLFMVIAEDMNIPMEMDYDFLVTLQYFVSDDKKNEICKKEKKDGGSIDLKEFLCKFSEKHNTYNSLTEYALSPDEESIGIVLFDIMRIFNMNPRKFLECELSDQECIEMLEQDEKWNRKKYGYILVIACLCKYINELEQLYLENSGQNGELEYWEEKQELQKLKKQIKEYEKMTELLHDEKKKMEEVLWKQEQQIDKLQVLLKETEEKYQKDKQELSALRTYVYVTDKKESDLMPELETLDLERMEFWKNKKVLVLGGHIHWQNKLKDLFPGWQFLSAGQSALLGEIVKGREIIVCNTSILDHSCYYKLMAEKEKGQKLIYTNSSNIQKCISELNAQIA